MTKNLFHEIIICVNIPFEIRKFCLVKLCGHLFLDNQIHKKKK